MSEPIRLTPISKPVQVIYAGRRFQLQHSVQSAIDAYWDALLQSGKTFTRGDVFTIEAIEEQESSLQIKVSLTDYAHYLATINHVSEISECPCRVVYTSVLIKTKDNDLVFGEMAEHTSTPHRLQCAGGGITRDDIQDDNVIGLLENAQMELLEETGIDCDNRDHKCKIRFSYLKQGGEGDFVGAMFMAETGMTSKEVKTLFQNHSASIVADGQKPEFTDLIFVKNAKKDIEIFLENNQKPINDYLPCLLLKCARRHS